MTKYDQIVQEAIARGAIKKACIYIDRNNVFSTHFFNNKDIEVMYLINDENLYTLTGGQEVNRVWGNQFNSLRDWEDLDLKFYAEEPYRV